MSSADVWGSWVTKRQASAIQKLAKFVLETICRTARMAATTACSHQTDCSVTFAPVELTRPVLASSTRPWPFVRSLMLKIAVTSRDPTATSSADACLLPTRDASQAERVTSVPVRDATMWTTAVPSTSTPASAWSPSLFSAFWCSTNNLHLRFFLKRNKSDLRQNSRQTF